jgi:hypothetical protein
LPLRKRNIASGTTSTVAGGAPMPPAPSDGCCWRKQRRQAQGPQQQVAIPLGQRPGGVWLAETTNAVSGPCCYSGRWRTTLPWSVSLVKRSLTDLLSHLRSRARQRPECTAC